VAAHGDEAGGAAGADRRGLTQATVTLRPIGNPLPVGMGILAGTWASTAAVHHEAGVRQQL
jgi:hypothetical protein